MSCTNIFVYTNLIFLNNSPGFASVDLGNILNSESDMIDNDVVVQDLRSPGSNLGKLNIRIEALELLRKIKEELRARAQVEDDV